MIKLDWDNISNEQMHYRIDRITGYKFVKSITVYQSPSLDGFHIEIESFNYLSPKVIFKYRANFYDDLNRLNKDIIFYLFNGHLETRDILHDFKIKSKMGVTMTFERIKLFKYFRLRYNAEWQVLKIEKNSQISILKRLEQSQQLSL